VNIKTGEEAIHTAQEQKLDPLCRKLMRKPGERRYRTWPACLERPPQALTVQS